MSPDTVLREIAEYVGRYPGRHNDLKKDAIDAFAGINGWRPSSCRSCNPGNLGWTTALSDWADQSNRDYWDLFDHGLWFRDGRQYVAVVGQPYDWRADDFEEKRARLRARGFVLHVPPDPLASIHYPGATAFLVVTLPGVAVRWLPEQDGRLARSWKARLRKTESA